MALTLTVVAEPGTASVLVTVTSTGGNAALFSLTRTDSNGVAPVRLLTGQGISSGTLIVRDSEAALTGTVGYTAVYSGGEAITKTTALNVVGAQLNLPVLPQFRVAVGGVDYEADRGTRSTVHHPIGRPDPVVALSRLQTRTGRLVFIAVNRDAADEIRAVYDRQEVTLLRFDGRVVADLYHVAEQISSRQAVEGSTAWTVEVRYIEVRRPPAPLAGALGWDYSDVAAYGSYLTVRSAFATYADLTVGNQ